MSPSPRSPSIYDQSVVMTTGRGDARLINPRSQVSALGLHELCHDLLQEVGVIELLLEQLHEEQQTGAVGAALRSQVRVLREALREARLPSPPADRPLRPLVLAVAETTRLVHGGPVLVDAPDDGVVACVVGEVRRALVNLVDNARQAAPSGTLRLSLHEVVDEVLLEVHDDGSAVPARTAGSSLGLAVVRDVAARHGGAVSERPSPLGGLAVTLRLPSGGA